MFTFIILLLVAVAAFLFLRWILAEAGVPFAVAIAGIVAAIIVIIAVARVVGDTSTEVEGVLLGPLGALALRRR